MPDNQNTALADDTPVVIGDSASAFIDSRTELDKYSHTGNTLTHPDSERKWSRIIVTQGGKSVSHDCSGRSCRVSLNFGSELELTVSSGTGSGLKIDSSKDFNEYQKTPNRWVHADIGAVTEGSVNIGGKIVQEIRGGRGKCQVEISYIMPKSANSEASSTAQAGTIRATTVAER